MLGRTWFWLRDRILALLSTPPTVQVRHGKKYITLPATRLQWALNPPDLD